MSSGLGISPSSAVMSAVVSCCSRSDVCCTLDVDVNGIFKYSAILRTLYNALLMNLLIENMIVAQQPLAIAARTRHEKGASKLLQQQRY